jgi:hypothetical protein
MEVVGFHNVLWVAVGRFVMMDSGGVGVILVMVLDRTIVMENNWYWP